MVYGKNSPTLATEDDRICCRIKDRTAICCLASEPVQKESSCSLTIDDNSWCITGSFEAAQEAIDVCELVLEVWVVTIDLFKGLVEVYDSDLSVADQRPSPVWWPSAYQPSLHVQFRYEGLTPRFMVVQGLLQKAKR